MKDEFSNENMLKILIEQKKYLEAYRLFKELVKNGIIKEPSLYKDLIKEVEQIDPVLTMDNQTREKKVERLSKILNRIRRLRQKSYKKEQPIKEKVSPATFTSIPDIVEKSPVEVKEPTKEIATAITPSDIIKSIEGFTAASISSIMNLICGNFSNEVLSKKPKANRIEILNEMLRRIEVIKNQRKKELLNV